MSKVTMIKLLGGPADGRKIPDSKIKEPDFVQILDLKTSKRKQSKNYYYTRTVLPGIYIYSGTQGREEMGVGTTVFVFRGEIVGYERVTPKFRYATITSESANGNDDK